MLICIRLLKRLRELIHQGMEDVEGLQDWSKGLHGFAKCGEKTSWDVTGKGRLEKRYTCPEFGALQRRR